MADATRVVIQAAHEQDRGALLTLMNRAFADYIVPVQLSLEAFDAMVDRDDIVLESSYVASVNGQATGFGLVAVRSRRHGTLTRLAAMGVAPEGRRSGIAKALLDTVIRDAWARGSDHVSLEVFAANGPARRLYEARGFVQRRDLSGYTLSGLPRPHRPLPDVALRTVAITGILPLVSVCAPDDASGNAPPWQLQAPSLARLRDPVIAYLIEAPGITAPVGYVVASRVHAEVRLWSLGVVPSHRRQGFATAALTALLGMASRADNVSLSIPPLVPADSELGAFLEARGARRHALGQIEMTRDR